MDEDDSFEKDYQHIQQFAEEFKTLVRKYMPEYPDNDHDAVLLMQMQEQTSCYSPWVWSSEE